MSAQEFEGKSAKRFYITTTLPYVNADPHIGFATELIRADIIARYQEFSGKKVFFNTGTDEHGLKIYQKAFDFGESPQVYVSRYVEKFKALKGVLNLWPGLNFIRTTDAHHVAAAQEFWRRCDKNGFIYKKAYKARYCPGCELERTDIEIENGRCFLHQNIDLIIIEEENYFFKFSAFKEQLLALYEQSTSFVVPETRFNEIKAFVSRGLEDFSISRLKEKMPWGVDVPGDSKHVMYVWFDALVSYIAAVGWPASANASAGKPDLFEDFWVNGYTVQYCGKDNLRQQSAMWQAMLMAAGLPNSKQIVINGFVTGEGGIKMSKSLGNVVDPADVVKEYGTDALRYFVARELHPFEDTQFTMERFKEAYNGSLANGLGNLVSRILKMCGTSFPNVPFREIGTKDRASLFLLSDSMKMNLKDRYDEHMNSFRIQSAAGLIWDLIKDSDDFIEQHKPFKLIKTDKKQTERVMWELLNCLDFIAVLLLPIIPVTAQKIQTCIKENKMPEAPLFPRKE